MGLCAYGDYNNSKNWKEYVVSNEYDLPFVSFGKNEENISLSPEDKASVLQKNFESALLEYLHKLKEKSYLDDNICFAGGCFLNVLANTLIKKSNLFENIHIPPFTNDSGISFGAAAYAVFIHENQCEIKIPENIALMSKIYTNEEIEQELQNFNLKYNKYNNFQEVCEFASQELNQNKIIGWFQNSSESGPRALGSRSLLIHPGPKENKDIMNLRVKHREYWRPFAGIILEEKLSEYFEEDFVSPYMLYSFKVKENKKDQISAIIHKDKTCRVQTITKEQHPQVHNLLKEFYKVSGIPVILNTSFNDNGEPIVETPEDAIKSFLNMDIDYLVIGNYIISKNKNKKLNKKSFSYR
jgi:carbamoyltransferase